MSPRLCRRDLERSDRAGELPFAQRMMLHLVHGIRASKDLLDLRDLAASPTEYRFLGHITRRFRTMVLILSGEALEAAHEQGVVHKIASGSIRSLKSRVIANHRNRRIGFDSRRLAYPSTTSM